MSFIPPVSEFHFGSTSASGGAVSAPVPIPSCTPPSIPPFPPVSQPQSTNPFTSAMSWGAPTRDGTPASRQQTLTSQPISQPQPVIFKPQPTQPQQYQQPPQQQYQYPETEERHDEEDEGWVPPAPQQPWNRGRGPPRRIQQHQQPPGQQGYNDQHFYGNPAQPLYFAQPRRQSVESHFQPREYDDSSPIYIPDNIESQVEIRPQLLGILPEFRGKQHHHVGSAQGQVPTRILSGKQNNGDSEGHSGLLAKTRRSFPRSIRSIKGATAILPEP
ncbi:hypothetical protein L2E82_10938 [Cichorium intybus]|uniref:Uncharacterized protein n=1 Tax=Cichorium intybus TaxID=13427 RepID=A0ACB9GBR1_CICIN|nr:hypothetical protein L2E82_10938 [Cichorium intybus]